MNQATKEWKKALIADYEKTQQKIVDIFSKAKGETLAACLEASRASRDTEDSILRTIGLIEVGKLYIGDYEK